MPRNFNTYPTESQHVSHNITTKVPRSLNAYPTESQHVSHGITPPQNHNTYSTESLLIITTPTITITTILRTGMWGGGESFSPRACLYYTLAEHFDLLYFLVTSGSRRKAAVYLLSVCLHYSLQINFFIFIRIIKILVSKLRAHQMRYSDYKFR